jgi:hypothetical protein
MKAPQRSDIVRARNRVPRKVGDISSDLISKPRDNPELAKDFWCYLFLAGELIPGIGIGSLPSA